MLLKSKFSTRSIEQGCTILTVTHDDRILDIADRIIPLEDALLASDRVPLNSKSDLPVISDGSKL